MSDKPMEVATFIARELHSLLFFEEFTFSRNKFSPPQGSELELADAVVMLGDALLIYQIKERSLRDAGDAETERRWFESAIRKGALRQIRDTLKYLRSYPEIWVPNERGRQFDLASEKFANILKVVVYRSSENLPADCQAIKCHVSKTAGFIHIVTAEDYLEIARTLRVPAEMVEYFKYREEVLTRFPDRHADLPDAVMTGQFISGNHNTLPTIESVKYLHHLIQDEDAWDISRFLRGIHNHLTTEFDNDYYAILIEFAKLPRSLWKNAKQRILLCLDKVRDGATTLPYRMAYPATDTGFVFIPVPREISEDPEWRNSKIRGLTNYTVAHKYEQKLSKCIGIQISKDHDYFDIIWCYVSHPWAEDAEIESALRKDNPFRPVKEAVESGYKFREDVIS